MNEKDFSQKITRTLNWGLSRIEEEKLAKLRVVRQKAMEAYREPVSALGLATLSGQILDVSSRFRKPLFWLPMLAIAVAIIAFSWNSADDIYDDVGELDAKILTGELPIDAFLDKDFASWVKESS